MYLGKVRIQDQHIRRLIAQGEHQQLDFKFEISDAMKIARTFSAFANTDGGKLLIGVKDNGRIAGVRSEEEYYMAESAAQLFCKPEVHFTTQKWMIEGKTILEISIPPSEQKPHFAKDRDGKWLAYMRVKDENLPAHPVLVKVWKLKKSHKGVFVHYSKVERALLDYLSAEGEITLPKFMRIAHIHHGDAENILARLIALGVISILFADPNATYRLTDREQAGQVIS